MFIRGKRRKSRNVWLNGGRQGKVGGWCRNLPFGGRATRDSRDACPTKGIRAESLPTFIERKTLEKPKETSHEEYSRFRSYLYV